MQADDLKSRMSLTLDNWRGEEDECDWWRYQREFAEAFDLITTLEATVERQAAEIARLREALGTIARDGVGLQNVMDDHLGDVNAYNYHAMNYWASDSQWRKAKARQALGDHNG